jgi:hypothetical protein
MSGDGDGCPKEIPGASDNFLRIVHEDGEKSVVQIEESPKIQEIDEPKKPLIEELISEFEASMIPTKFPDYAEDLQEESLVFTVEEIEAPEILNIEEIQEISEIPEPQKSVETECTEQLMPVLNFKLGPIQPSIEKPQDYPTENFDSMAWIDEPTSLLFPSIQYPSILTQISENEAQSEDPELKKILDLCQDSKKETMQLFFMNETEQLMQLYDEAADKNLINKIGDADIARVQKMCEEMEETGENFVLIDILKVT